MIGAAIACVCLLAVIFVPMVIQNSRRIRGWWRDVSGPLP